MTLTTPCHDMTGEPASVVVPDDYASEVDLFLYYQRLHLACGEVLREDKSAPVAVWDAFRTIERVFVNKFQRLRSKGVFRSIFDAHTEWSVKS